MHTTKLITLHGGPCNKDKVEDTGQSQIEIGVADSYEYTTRGKMPATGARVGSAIYEVAKQRDAAFWLHNEWMGRRLGEAISDLMEDLDNGR